ncbi:histidine phosphatase family protein [Streptococcus thermophilus]|uniref:2,3-bisphosphoglycerate-dependent phosphoglycerate mutase n=1 Tax=Streptococcus equinus TaxID=1335 RepID=A0A1H1AXB8_STREI|nr:MULTISPECIES: histidine phosphatase family protein [Streptococcus]MCE2063370.1 histidine phosphatase family protein [Streptococcus thermophilus]MCE2066257.1 histidine phosphatase family protein [Streptococcus thermophilus]MCE2068439.1 histidine phosphatase family protein [Streptococcus thermophilus]MCE2073009.1 histidine phosphatase family protein [Streptococcus thermophilus]MCE2075092.1 histidine phosphatase family protein [Streptococcus thermophilus]
MKTIYFIRHAEPDRTVEDEVKRPLSLKGQKQSEELSEYFVNKRLKYIYCSPYVRTRQTANYISNKNNIPIFEVNALHERVISKEWIPTLNFTEYSYKQWKDRSYKISTGESLNEAFNRFKDAVEKIISSTDENETVVIVTHATVISLFLNYIDSNFDWDSFCRISTPDVFKIIFNSENIIKWEHIDFSKEV